MLRSGTGGFDVLNEFMNPTSDFRSGRFTNKLLNRATTIQTTMNPRDLQAMCVSAYALYNGRQPERQIGPYTLYAQTPTLLLYHAGDTYVVAVRGTQGPLNGEDWSANATIPFQGLAFTNRWKKDLETIRQWKSQFPGDQWYATGHSLGGGICDELLRNGFVKEAFTFNPAVQPAEQANVSLLKNNRVYTVGDPLYTLFGVKTVGAKLVTPDNINQALLHLTDPLYSHSLTSFNDSPDVALGRGKKNLSVGRKHTLRGGVNVRLMLHNFGSYLLSTGLVMVGLGGIDALLNATNPAVIYALYTMGAGAIASATGLGLREATVLRERAEAFVLQGNPLALNPPANPPQRNVEIDVVTSIDHEDITQGQVIASFVDEPTTRGPFYSQDDVNAMAARGLVLDAHRQPIRGIWWWTANRVPPGAAPAVPQVAAPVAPQRQVVGRQRMVHNPLRAARDANQPVVVVRGHGKKNLSGTGVGRKHTLRGGVNVRLMLHNLAKFLVSSGVLTLGIGTVGGIVAAVTAANPLVIDFIITTGVGGIASLTGLSLRDATVLRESAEQVVAQGNPLAVRPPANPPQRNVETDVATYIDQLDITQGQVIASFVSNPTARGPFYSQDEINAMAAQGLVLDALNQPIRGIWWWTANIMVPAAPAVPQVAAPVAPQAAARDWGFRNPLRTARNPNQPVVVAARGRGKKSDRQYTQALLQGVRGG